MTMRTLDYILSKWSLRVVPGMRMPVEIPNTGRADLATLFHELDFRVGAEIGVKRGHYSKHLCETNPQAKVFGVDPYQEYSEYPDVVYQDGFDSWKVDMEAMLAPYPNFTHIRKFSMDSVRQFSPGDLDFVYIDANHAMEYVTEDIVEWTKVVRPGGIVSGHDFSRFIPTSPRPHNQVYEAVHAYTSKNSIWPWFALGRKSETDPKAVRDRVRSWFFVVGENLR